MVIIAIVVMIKLTIKMDNRIYFVSNSQKSDEKYILPLLDENGEQYKIYSNSNLKDNWTISKEYRYFFQNKIT